MRKLTRLLSIFAILFLFSSARAAITPLSVSIVPPVQFPPEDFTITGVRVSALWGKHWNIYGIDLAAVGNITEQRFLGIGLSGLFNWTRGQTTILGLQFAGIANINVNNTKAYGLQAALISNYQTVASSIVGFQVSLVNLGTFTDVYGAQVGLLNHARNIYGFQIGLINFAETVHGLQIGLANFNRTGLFAVSPILNFGF